MNETPSPDQPSGPQPPPAADRRWTVDLHTHTIYSRDCLTRTLALVERARTLGLDRIAVTEHNRLDGALAAKALAPDIVIVGEEIKTTHGEIIAYYVQEEVPRGLSPREGLIAAVKIDTLSLLAYEVGMFAWMGFRAWLYPDLEPTSWTYWLMMQVAMILGFATTYPVNCYGKEIRIRG